MTKSTNAIRVSLIRAPETESTEQPAPPSVNLYIAGLLVSLSGMYAVTYDMNDSNFALILRLLIVCGYAVSYWIRKRRVDLRQYQAPLFVVFATAMYFVASTSPDLSNAASQSGLARPYQVQTVIIWIAVLQSFTLCTDSALMFACVPSMALIGIMSSGTPDPEVQYAFVVFLASATFIMVHENHLRTRAALAKGLGSVESLDKQLLGGEITLVACCILGTLFFASVIASPIEIVGRALIPVNGQDQNKSSQNKQNSGTAALHVDDGDSVQIGAGPVSASDTALLAVNLSPNIPVPYLRGATYDYYTGYRFQDRLKDKVENVVPSRYANGAGAAESGKDITQVHGALNTNEYILSSRQLGIAPAATKGAASVSEHIKVLGGISTHLYGAPEYQSIYTDYKSLRVEQSGAVTVDTSMIEGIDYAILSMLPTSDQAVLRGASANVPPAILEPYLQVSNTSRPKSSALQHFADDSVAGINNQYDRVAALSRAIAKQCSYNLQAPALPPDRDAVEAFLFDTKQGYCDCFAAALTVLCRYEGIPARYATGFLMGDRQADGSFTIREKHKHAWTEVYFAEYGWIPFDATENAQDITPTNAAGTAAAASPLRWLLSHGVGPPIVALAIILLVLYVIRTEALARIRKKRLEPQGYAALPAANMQIVQIYTGACNVLARAGYARNRHITPMEYRIELMTSLGSNSVAGAMLDELTVLHERFSYGNSTANENDVSSARDALKRLMSAASKLPRRPDPV